MTYPSDKAYASPKQGRIRRHTFGVAGYTLIEVLLTAAIVILGMTGILTMQVVGIRITEDSRNRTVAVTLAYQMTDYLRANCPNIATYAGFTACRSGSRNPQDEQTCAYDDDGDTSEDSESASIAEQDMGAWWDMLQDSRLPNWFAAIQSASGGVVRVAVQWDKARVLESSPDADETSAGGAAQTRRSCLDNGQRILAPGIEEVCFNTIPCPDQ